jgi:ferric-chelate reductase [NAD(P)H]
MDHKALMKFSYGLYVVSSINKSGAYNGQIADAVFQASSDPVLIGVCINKQNLTHEYILESGVFTITVLAVDTPMNFIGHFGFKSGRAFNKFDSVGFRLGELGAPIVTDNAIAIVEAKVIYGKGYGSRNPERQGAADLRLLPRGKARIGAENGPWISWRETGGGPCRYWLERRIENEKIPLHCMRIHL